MSLGPRSSRSLQGEPPRPILAFQPGLFDAREGARRRWRAHETIGPETRIRSDFNGDGKVNFADFVRFAAAFGKTREGPGFDPLFDLTGDGKVSFGDFVAFAQDFGKGG